MEAKPYLLKETNWKTVKDIDYKVAILPWGATEAHNFHLPFGTDIFETEYCAEQSAKIAWEKGAKIIVLPTIPFGVNTSQMDLKMTINMNPSTQAKILADVIESLENYGIEKLVILNGHGGNDFKQIIRELQKGTKILLTSVNWYLVEDKKGYFDEINGDHADEMETSFMLHIYPQFVLPLNEAGNGTAKQLKLNAFKEKWAWTPRKWSSVTNDTGIGNPKLATAEKGEKYINAVISKIAQFLFELYQINTEDFYE
jgi:creatinine amidohydrolase